MDCTTGESADDDRPNDLIAAGIQQLAVDRYDAKRVCETEINGLATIELSMEVFAGSEGEEVGDLRAEIEIEFPSTEPNAPDAEEIQNENPLDGDPDGHWDLLVKKVKTEVPDSIDFDEEGYDSGSQLDEVVTLDSDTAADSRAPRNRQKTKINKPEKSKKVNDEVEMQSRTTRGGRKIKITQKVAQQLRGSLTRRTSARSAGAPTGKSARGRPGRVGKVVKAQIEVDVTTTSAHSDDDTEDSDIRLQFDDDILWYECKHCPYSANQEKVVSDHVGKVHAKKVVQTT